MTGCLGAVLAVPAVAGAVPINGVGPAVPVSSYHPHGRPAAVGVAAGHYALPSSFKTDAQTRPPAVTTVPVSHASATSQLTGDSDHTLAIVLASTALGVALFGTAYAAFRVTRIQRRLAGSSS
ncbi:MAG TPA: hypothetical protein VFL87_07920 [Thermoleophilaceae bacterium]|nr:hypothetical protein [Thermoleophilaceae bacterium]